MEFSNCPCAGASLPRFLQPVILAILLSGPMHGYRLMQRLRQNRFFQDCPPDITGVYRMLKNMEQEGSLIGTRDAGESGPSRCRYAITDRGTQCLRQWERTLQEHQQFIQDLRDYLHRTGGEATSLAEEHIN